MFCPNCGTKFAGNFCANCGARKPDFTEQTVVVKPEGHAAKKDTPVVPASVQQPVDSEPQAVQEVRTAEVVPEQPGTQAVESNAQAEPQSVTQDVKAQHGTVEQSEPQHVPIQQPVQQQHAQQAAQQQYVQKPRKAKINKENWVGIKLFNRVGALLIIIGAIATAVLDTVDPILRTAILFAFALAVVVGGEIMNRKKTTTASIGVSATGVALVYVAIAASYFGLETIGMYTALIATVLATAIGIILATRYKSQVIGCFALIGGYLPIFVLDPVDNPLVIGLVVYFVVLSAFSLVLALHRKWSGMNIVGFVLTVIGASYIGWLANSTTALVYACFAFLLYTAIPLIAAYRTKEKFGNVDFCLVILNMFISPIVIFLIANRLDIQHLHAYLCLAFAIIYAGLAMWVKRAFERKSMQILFALAAIAFCVLFVPFYFEQRWFAIAWLVQATLLACFGILAKAKVAEISGLSILAIAAYAFGIEFGIAGAVSTLNYTFFTAGTLAIFGCYIAKARQQSGFGQVYKILAFVNLLIFAVYVMLSYIEFDTVGTLVVLAAFALSYIFAKVPVWKDGSTLVLANVIHFAGLFWLWGSLSMYTWPQNSGGMIFGLLTAIIATGMVVHHHLTEKRNGWTVAYKNINLINLWLTCLAVFGWFMGENGFFAVQPLLILFTFAYAFAITKISAISDMGTKVIAMIMHIIGLVWLLGFNSLEYRTNIWELLALNAILQVVALIAINDIINLCDGTKAFVVKILVMSGYFMFVTTQTMMVQGDIAFSSAIISIMYAVLAFAWIVVGFRLKNKPVRTAGLVLSMAAVAKLLIVDTWGLSTEMRIISYISLGVILMLISFVYQKLSKGIE